MQQIEVRSSCISKGSCISLYAYFKGKVLDFGFKVFFYLDSSKANFTNLVTKPMQQ